MSQNAAIYVTVRIKNPKAIRALRRVRELADEIAEDYPWSEAAKEMQRAARCAMKHIEFQNER